MSLIRACLLCLFFIYGLHTTGYAKTVMLKTTIVSMSTEHGVLQAEIHFDERDAEIAKKVENVIGTDLIKIINYFQYVPRDIVHFNVDPYMRMANGNARVFPDTVINLYNFPASNNDHLVVLEDWLKGLIFHEFIHVVHLDQTRGFVEDGRRIFGSILKVLTTNVVPRWFTEGIATWGESHLTEGGRLSNKLFRKELLVQFLRGEYCETIDCLDTPGVYPKGQLAYWAGAQFMEYLEMQKPGTVRCLVISNSSDIPFFLNDSFKLCTGSTAQHQFAEFRKQLIGQASTDESWGEKINNAFGSDYFQKGIILDGDILYKVEASRYTEALLSYDLSEPNGLSLIKQVYRYPIEDLAGIVQGTSQEGEPLKYLLVSFVEDPHYRKESKKWKLINSETLLIEKHLQFKNDPSYVVALSTNHFLTASYINNHWIIEEQKLDEVQGETKELYSFANKINVVAMKQVGAKILLKVNDGEQSHLLVSDLGMKSFSKIHSSVHYFEIPITNENFLVIDEQGSQQFVEIDAALKEAKFTPIKKELLKNVTFAEVNENRVLFLENRLKTKSMPIKESMAFLKADRPSSARTLATMDIPKTETEGTQLKTENYPQLYHLAPNYWFFAAGSGENVTSYGAQTTLNDPMFEHFVTATALVYPSISKVGGSLSWLHRIMSISDLWSVQAFVNQDYSKAEINSSLMDSSDWSVGTAYQVLLKKWVYVPGIFVSGSSDVDFISDRSTNSLGTRQTLTYQALQYDDLLQLIVANLKLQDDYPNVGKDFLNLYSSLFVLGRFTDRLEMGIQTAYGKLFKSDFNRGVLYGGGVNTIIQPRNFEFYGIPYSNAFGNEIFTIRAFGEYNFWNIYRGKNFFPVFFKEAHFLLGRETIYADRIFLENVLYREESLSSYFAGLRLQTNLFYYIPTNIDFIFSSTRKPNGGDANSFNFIMNAELF